MDLLVDTGFQAYDVAMDATRRGLAIVPRLKQGCPKLADQFSRALTSVPLNISEGSGRQGKDRKQFFRIAYGSANEASTCSSNSLLELAPRTRTRSSNSNSNSLLELELELAPRPRYATARRCKPRIEERDSR